MRLILALLFTVISGAAWGQCTNTNGTLNDITKCPGSGGNPAFYDSIYVNPANPIVGSTQATGGNTPITLANRAAQIVNVADFGATTSDTIGSTNVASINAATAYARTLIATDGNLPVKFVIPRGEYVTNGSLNFTGINGPGTSGTSNFDIDAYGAVIHGENSGAIVDTMGSKYFSLRGLTVEGDCSTVPATGIQMGRVNTGALDGGGSGVKFKDVRVLGCFSLTGFYNFTGEVGTFDNLWVTNSYASGSFTTCFAIVQDGLNHFGVTSGFVTQNAPADTAQPFTLDLFLSAQAVTTGGCTPIWQSGGQQHSWRNSYAANTYTSGYEVMFYLLSAQISTPSDQEMELHAEGGNGATDVFFLTGNNATPQFVGFRYRENSTQVSRSVFKLDTPVTSPSMLHSELEIALPQSAIMFNEPTAWRFDGNGYAPDSTIWNLPYYETTGVIDIGGTTNIYGAAASCPSTGCTFLAPVEINISGSTSSTQMFGTGTMTVGYGINLSNLTCVDFCYGSTGFVDYGTGTVQVAATGSNNANVNIKAPAGQQGLDVFFVNGTPLWQVGASATGVSIYDLVNNATLVGGTSAGNLVLGEGGSATVEINGALKSGATAAVSCPAGTVSLTTLTVTNGIATHC